MAYTLKDWDREIQAESLSYGLVALEEAEAPVKGFFRAVYAEMLSEELAREKTSVDQYNADLKSGTVSAVLANVFKGAPRAFEPAKIKRKFEKRFHDTLRGIPARYPDSILFAVADVRLLALRIVSPHVMALIRQYQAECKVRVARKTALLHAHQSALEARYPKFQRFYYHDWEIVSFRREKRDMVMKLEIHEKVTFKNAMVLRRDGPLRGLMWHSAEVRPLEPGFEIEMLARGRDTRLVILRCDDVEMERVPDGTPGYSMPGGEDR